MLGIIANTSDKLKRKAKIINLFSKIISIIPPMISLSEYEDDPHFQCYVLKLN